MDFDRQQIPSTLDKSKKKDMDYQQQTRKMQKKLIWTSMAVIVFSVLSVSQMQSGIKLDNSAQQQAEQPETYILTPSSNTNIVVSQRDTFRDGVNQTDPASLISDNILQKSGKRFVAPLVFLNWSASNARSQWSSFSITNTEDSDATVTLRFYDMEGKRVGTDSDHRLTITPGQRAGTYRSLDDIIEKAMLNGGNYADNKGFLGSVEIVSDKNISVIRRNRLTENRVDKDPITGDTDPSNDLQHILKANESQKANTFSDISLSPEEFFSNTYSTPLFLVKHPANGIGVRTQWSNFMVSNAGDGNQALNFDIYDKRGLFLKRIHKLLKPHASFNNYRNTDFLSSLGNETVGTVKITADKASTHLWEYGCDHPSGGPCAINYVNYLSNDLAGVDDPNNDWQSNLPPNNNPDAMVAYYDYGLRAPHKAQIRVYVYKGDRLWNYNCPSDGNGGVKCTAGYTAKLDASNALGGINDDAHIYGSHPLPKKDIDAALVYVYPHDTNQPISATNEEVRVSLYKGDRLWEYVCDASSCQASRATFLSNNFASISNQGVWSNDPIPTEDIDAATAFYAPSEHRIRVFIYQGNKVWNYNCADGGSCEAGYVKNLSQDYSAMGAIDGWKDALKNQPLPVSNLSAVATYWDMDRGGHIQISIYDSSLSTFDTTACEVDNKRCSGNQIEVCGVDGKFSVPSGGDCSKYYASCVEDGEGSAVCEYQYDPCSALEENSRRCSNKYPNFIEFCELDENNDYVWKRTSIDAVYQDTDIRINCSIDQFCSDNDNVLTCVDQPTGDDKCDVGTYNCSTDGKSVFACQDRGVFNLSKTCESGTSCNATTGTCDGGNVTSDLDGDGTVGVSDLRILIEDWGTSASDLDGDETVGVSDLRILIEDWGDI